MNKIEIGLLIAVIGIVCYVGALTYYEMAYELEQHPEIKDIGGPPVITDLRLVAVVIGFAVMMCSILLYMNKEVKNDKEKR